MCKSHIVIQGFLKWSGRLSKKVYKPLYLFVFSCVVQISVSGIKSSKERGNHCTVFTSTKFKGTCISLLLQTLKIRTSPGHKPFYIWVVSPFTQQTSDPHFCFDYQNLSNGLGLPDHEGVRPPGWRGRTYYMSVNKPL